MPAHHHKFTTTDWTNPPKVTLNFYLDTHAYAYAYALHVVWVVINGQLQSLPLARIACYSISLASRCAALQNLSLMVTEKTR